jgi:hypothetical protein
VQALAQVLAQRETWRSTGDLRCCAATNASARPPWLPMGLAMDGCSAVLPAPATVALLRNWGMKGFDRSGPLKDWMARQAMGTR